MKTAKEYVADKVREHYDELKREFDKVCDECRTVQERILLENPEVILARAKRAAVSASLADAFDRMRGIKTSAESVKNRNQARATYATLRTEYRQN